MNKTIDMGGNCALDDSGWCSGVAHVQSPNFDARPEGIDISLLVIHNISLPAGRFGLPYITDLFCNRLDHAADPSFDDLRGVKVSAHFLIDRDGVPTQFVSADARAWHAGLSSFDGRARCNDFSIGIELEGTDSVPFTDSQYQSLAVLTAALLHRYRLTDVAGHQHIAPGRKTDPGPCFDWIRYRALLQQNDDRTSTPQLLRFSAFS